MKKQYKIKKLIDPISGREAAYKVFVDTFFDNPEKNNAYAEFSDKNLDNFRFVKINTLPAINQHLTHMQYVEDALDEICLVRTN